MRAEVSRIVGRLGWCLAAVSTVLGSACKRADSVPEHTAASASVSTRASVTTSVAAPASASALPNTTPPSTTGSSASDAALLDPNDDGIERCVAWGVRGGAEESYWLEWRPPGLEVLGRRSGALIYAAGGVFRFRRTRGSGQGLKDCDEAFGLTEPRASNHFVVEVQGASAQRLDADGEVVVAAPEPVEGVSSYSNSVELEASFGPLLFVHQSVDALYCTAAHGTNTNDYSVFDLAEQKPVTYPSERDEEVLRAAARLLPKAELKPCIEIAEPPEVGDGSPLAGLSLVSAVPRWSPGRELMVDLGFVIMRSYVEGLKSCDVSVAAMPPSLEGVRVPDGFVKLAAKLPGFEPRGWSLHPGDPVTLEALRRAFRKSTPQPKRQHQQSNPR